ncbi:MULTISPECIES: DEAD/DEAH box helicase [unclassified Lentimonas]|uniref:DEAD/DEAH box helicase n=1 Tax=unclassified Lentimonas TaxID=2630993 RepID=UPI001FD25105|nr:MULTISPECIES: DEAD/DEAH box helicase [unclassified Lentimonas]
MSQPPQPRDLYFGLDVLVATTGRLLVLMRQGYANLTGVECLVLDEATAYWRWIVRTIFMMI